MNNEKGKTLADLREHLFETIERLKDKENPMEVEKAQAISKVADTIINTAKVELQFLNTVGQSNLPEIVQPQKAGHFFEQKKGLNTGKSLGALPERRAS